MLDSVKVLLILSAMALVCCDEKEHGSAESKGSGTSATETFATFDQVAAFPTARPAAEGIRYKLTIQNIGSVPIVVHSETIQQWQPFQKDPRDLAEWNEHIPMTDSIARVEIAPEEEYTCEVEPIIKEGGRLRFGFLVYCRAGREDVRRLRVWTEAREPSTDFAKLPGTAEPILDKPAEQAGPQNP